MSYLLVEIGCLECGHNSRHLGIHDTIEAATAAASAHNSYDPEVIVVRHGDDPDPEVPGSPWSGEGVFAAFEL